MIIWDNDNPTPFKDMINQVICGDCLDVMKHIPDKSVDLVLTDPPYGLGSTNFVHARAKKRKDERWNDSIPDKKCFNEIYRISEDQIIWGCNYFNGNIKNVGRIVHYKEPSSLKGPLKLSECDLASQSFDRRIRYFHYQWWGNVQGGHINWKAEGPDARCHPTQKPIPLMRWCLETYSKKDDLILDAFNGSGTTLVACKMLGKRFIGIEKEIKYCEMAERRLAQKYLF